MKSWSGLTVKDFNFHKIKEGISREKFIVSLTNPDNHKDAKPSKVLYKFSNKENAEAEFGIYSAFSKVKDHRPKIYGLKVPTNDPGYIIEEFVASKTGGLDMNLLRKDKYLL